ncbi:MAG: putative rane protein [Alphaproteobacteria bacterium]|nr:putative rane protein [Alphaproteobacteria bacterium]
MKLSITTAWNETSVFVKQEAGPLFLIAFGLMSLPSLILQAVAPRLLLGTAAMTPGTVPDPARMLAALPMLLLLAIPVILLSIWGHLTLNMLALRRETVIGNAFGHAARRILPLIGAWLIWFVGAIILIVPLAAFAVSGIKSGHPGLPVLLLFILWLLLIFVSIRLILMTPVAAAESIGPVGILRRSWDLTSGHFWKLLGFLALIVLVFIVFAVVVGAVGGILLALVAGAPTPGSLSSFGLQLITGILQAIFLTYFVVMVARIYVQLSGGVASVGQVFE